MRKTNTQTRLTVALIFSLTATFVLGWCVLNPPSGKSLELLISSLIPNVITSLLSILGLFFVYGDSVFNIEVDKIVNNNQDRIINADEQPETVQDSSDVFSAQQESNKFRSPVLDGLCGYWIESIPGRLNDGYPFSVAKFEFDEQEGQYVFSGTSFDLNQRKAQYKWKSVFLLPLVEISKHKFFIYYLYKRSDNSDHNGKYGIGKLLARNEKADDSNDFVLSQGFFFNEVTRDRSFDMVIKRLPDVAHALDVAIAGQEENKQKIIGLLLKLKESKIYENWKFNEHDDIDEKDTGRLIELFKKAK